MPEGSELPSGPRDRSLASPAQIRATPRARWVQGPHLSSLRLPGLALSSGCPLGAFMTPFYQGTALPWPGRSRVPAPEPIQPPRSPCRGILSLQPPIFSNVTSRQPPPAPLLPPPTPPRPAAGSPHNSASRAYYRRSPFHLSPEKPHAWPHPTISRDPSLGLPHPAPPASGFLYSAHPSQVLFTSA